MLGAKTCPSKTPYLSVPRLDSEPFTNALSCLDSLPTPHKAHRPQLGVTYSGSLGSMERVKPHLGRSLPSASTPFVPNQRAALTAQLAGRHGACETGVLLRNEGRSKLYPPPQQRKAPYVSRMPGITFYPGLHRCAGRDV